MIDCHCHAGAGAGIDLGAGHPSAFARYVMRSRAAGIARTVLFAGFRPDYASANREVARLAAASPGRFLWFACVHPQRDRGRVGALLDEAIRLGAVGVKAHRRDAVLTDEVCDAARARALPILYDPRGEIDVVERFARAYPDVPFIVPHLGSFEDDVAAQRRLIDPLSSIQNLHADTSGVRAFDLLEEALRRAGPGKLLFGSDGPWLHPGVELEKVRLLRLPAEEEALVLGGNLLRLTGASLTPARPAQGSAARSA